ncbi:MAG: hypothetical protein DYH12_28955, partial [Sorangiineae bacterium PRO1]|nr:hypothetical protein [Sorangiineae bacterium PRO1]
MVSQIPSTRVRTSNSTAGSELTEPAGWQPDGVVDVDWARGAEAAASVHPEGVYDGAPGVGREAGAACGGAAHVAEGERPVARLEQDSARAGVDVELHQSIGTGRRRLAPEGVGDERVLAGPRHAEAERRLRIRWEASDLFQRVADRHHRDGRLAGRGLRVALKAPRARHRQPLAVRRERQAVALVESVEHEHLPERLRARVDDGEAGRQGVRVVGAVRQERDHDAPSGGDHAVRAGLVAAAGTRQRRREIDAPDRLGRTRIQDQHVVPSIERLSFGIGVSIESRHQPAGRGQLQVVVRVRGEPRAHAELGRDLGRLDVHPGDDRGRVAVQEHQALARGRRGRQHDVTRQLRRELRAAGGAGDERRGEDLALPVQQRDVRGGVAFVLVRHGDAAPAGPGRHARPACRFGRLGRPAAERGERDQEDGGAGHPAPEPSTAGRVEQTAAVCERLPDVERSPRIVAFGELLFDLFPDGPRLGGAAANMAFHAAALGARALLVSRVGDDPLGRRAR